MVTVTEVLAGSHAARCGIVGGDALISINNHEIRDVLDYRFYLTERVVALKCCRDGRSFSVRIVKGEYEDIGLCFETPLMSEKQRCKNGCIFCFIDQNPRGMRETVYFKDDDSRLSFLHGNYVTLTNMTDADIDRILTMRFSPVNISVHTTNPALRVKMMKNKRAGEVLSYLDRLYEGNIRMCGQVVLCRGINDGDELRRTLTDLSRYFPVMSSVSVIPAGLTAHRDGLYPISDFTPEEAAEVIDTVEAFAAHMKEGYGSRMFFLADEFYLKAGRPIPPAAYYEEYEQIENGVGMLRSFEESFLMGEEDAPRGDRLTRDRTVSVATGEAAYPLLARLCGRLSDKYSNLQINVYKIVNNFFGTSITVAGLMTGRDLREQLLGKPLGEELLLPKSALRAGEDVFLCDMTVEELSSSLGVRVRAVDSDDGYAFSEALLGEENTVGEEM